MRIFLIAALLIFSLPAVAQTRYGYCNYHERILFTLEGTFGEKRVFKGLTKDKGYTGLWVNVETQTWSVASVWDGGITCIIASGTGYGLMRPEDIPPVGPDA